MHSAEPKCCGFDSWLFLGNMQLFAQRGKLQCQEQAYASFSSFILYVLFLNQPLAISRCCLHIRKLEMSLIHIESVNSAHEKHWLEFFYIVTAFIRCTICIITWKKWHWLALFTLIVSTFILLHIRKALGYFFLLLIASVGRSHSFVVFACRNVADV